MPFEALQIGAHFRGGLIAEVAILIESFLEDFLELFGYFRIEAYGRNRRAVHDGVKDDSGSVAAKGQLPGGHFVEYDAKGKEIGARVQFLAANLFGRHVSDRA